MRDEKFNHPRIGNRSTEGCQQLDQIINHEVFKMKLNEIRLVQKYQGKEQSIKVSVIMPTWNRAFIIARAVESVLNQSYKNYELIISDDGSTDATEELVKANYGNDRRIKYLKNRHRGVSHTRNVGLEHSSGSLIAYLDSDNVWSKNYLLLMVNSFVEHPEADTMYCGIKVIDNVNNIDFVGMKTYDRKSFLIRSYIDMNVFMHRRVLFEKLKGFREDLTALEDWELIIRYTEDKPPFVLECCLVNYYLEKNFGHLTLTEDLGENHNKFKQSYY